MESPKKLRIAIDAMGGDYAPEREIAGAVDALRTSNEKFEIILVGDEQAIIFIFLLLLMPLKK